MKKRIMFRALGVLLFAALLFILPADNGIKTIRAPGGRRTLAPVTDRKDATEKAVSDAKSGTAAGEERMELYGAFRLPASLRIIGEEAFEGTAVSVVEMPKTVTVIESRAFANTPNLKEAYLPGSIEILADSAFEGAKDLTVYGVKGSAAETWAARNGYAFIVRDIWAEAEPWRFPAESFVCILLLALVFWLVDQRKKQKLRWITEAVQRVSMCHKKRAELFVRELCFP